MKKSSFIIILLSCYSFSLVLLGTWLGTHFCNPMPISTINDNATSSEVFPESNVLVAENNLEDVSSLPNDITDSNAEAEKVALEQYLPDDTKALQLLESMTLSEKVYQMFIVTQEQLTGYTTVTRSGAATKEAILKRPVGGIIYFEPNIISPQQCTEMIQNIQSFSKLGLFIAVDEEGGRVARLGNNTDMGTTAFPSMSGIGSSEKIENAYQVGYTIGSEITEFGFNVDFAPVADVNSNPSRSVIGERSFGSDSGKVSKMVAATVSGFQDSNMLCTLKHFPGHGDTTTDSHDGYTEIDKTLEELKTTEFPPFEAGIKAGADFVMVGHLSVPKVTGDKLPATLSPTVIQLLREELGFDGLIITDSMSMGAIANNYSSGEAAVKAIQAGVDIILMPKDLDVAETAIENAVENGMIDEKSIDESVLKILQKKIDSGIITVE